MEMLVGILGVIVGALLQFIYTYIAEKRALKNDYKKLCVAEWFLFITQVSELINNPKDYNHIIFSQYIEQKTVFIKYIEKSKKTDLLILEINKKKDSLSLGDYAEKALNVENCLLEKALLMREVTILVNKVITDIYNI